MLKVLLVEDDNFKSEEIQSLLLQLEPRVHIRIARSVSSAVGAIQQTVFDLVVLDMALPSHTPTAGTGAPLSLLTGGLEVIFELQSLERKDPCLIITQYPEIEICGDFFPVQVAAQAIEENYGTAVLGCLEYSEAGSEWRSDFTAYYKKLCES